MKPRISRAGLKARVFLTLALAPAAEPPSPEPVPTVRLAPMIPQTAPAVSPATGAPRNVRAGTPRTDNVTLSWDSAGAGVTYNVYHGSQNDAGRASLGAELKGTSIKLTGLESESTYYFWVSAVRDGLESAKSLTVFELRWKQRFANFERAWQVFCRILGRYQAAPSDEVAQMALTQAFEFTYELAWQTMKDYVENADFDRVGGSRDAIRTAFQAGLPGSDEELKKRCTD